jgi:uncharacterized protein YjbJ (UPF0337 family)
MRGEYPRLEANYMDATGLKWQGRWDQLKAKAKRTWGQLTDDDLAVAEGDFEGFVGHIKEITGETAEEITERLEADDNSDVDDDA